MPHGPLGKDGPLDGELHLLKMQAAELTSHSRPILSWQQTGLILPGQTP